MDSRVHDDTSILACHHPSIREDTKTLPSTKGSTNNQARGIPNISPGQTITSTTSASSLTFTTGTNISTRITTSTTNPCNPTPTNGTTSTTRPINLNATPRATVTNACYVTPELSLQIINVCGLKGKLEIPEFRDTLKFLTLHFFVKQNWITRI